MADDDSIVVTGTSEEDGSEGFAATKIDTTNGTVVWKWQVNKLNVSCRKGFQYLKPRCALENHGFTSPTVKSRFTVSIESVRLRSWRHVEANVSQACEPNISLPKGRWRCCDRGLFLAS